MARFSNDPKNGTPAPLRLVRSVLQEELVLGFSFGEQTHLQILVALLASWYCGLLHHGCCAGNTGAAVLARLPLGRGDGGFSGGWVFRASADDNLQICPWSWRMGMAHRFSLGVLDFG